MLSVDSDAKDAALFAVEVDLPHFARAGQGKDGQLRVGLQQRSTDECDIYNNNTIHTATLILTNTNCFLRFTSLMLSLW